MIFYLLYTSSLWNKMDNKNRFFRLILVATILYTLIYTLINFVLLKDADTINRYNKYCYIFLLFDVLYIPVCGYRTYKEIGNHIKKKHNKKQLIPPPTQPEKISINNTQKTETIKKEPIKQEPIETKKRGS